MRNNLGVNYRKNIDRCNHFEELSVVQRSKINFLESKIDSQNKEIKVQKIMRYISYSIFMFYIILTNTILK